MAQQTINVGTNPNDGTGDSLRNGFIKTNDNFTELYSDKENTANKSATTTLGTSDVLFPTQNAVKTYVDNGLSTKQNTLISGTNIKTINGNSLLGSGDLTITGGISGSGTDNYIPRFNGTTALENSIIFDNGTNIGIGTDSPFDKLDVNGSFRFRGNTSNFTAVNNSGVIDYVSTSIFPTDPQVRIVALGSSSVGASIVFQTGVNSGSITERMRLTATGYVGIRTSTPDETLHVNGNLKIADGGTTKLHITDTILNGIIEYNGFMIDNTITQFGIDVGAGSMIGVIASTDAVFTNSAREYFGLSGNESKLIASNSLMQDSPGDPSTITNFIKIEDENGDKFYLALYQ